MRRKQGPVIMTGVSLPAWLAAEMAAIKGDDWAITSREMLVAGVYKLLLDSTWIKPEADMQVWYEDVWSSIKLAAERRKP